MRDLDGSEAGGQFLRTALALAALEDDPVHIENVRGARSTPGLRHQHLAVLETMAAVCDADVSGADLGAETVTFDPRSGPDRKDADAPRIPGGRYRADIGTAGSVTLLFDALLPLATRLEAPLSVTATGGTDVTWAPPADYYRHVKLPLCRRFGLNAAVEVDRRGFYPEGGGTATLHLAPSELSPIDLGARGAVEGVRVYSTEAAALAESDVVRRQAAGALERLGLRDGASTADEGPTTADLEVAERVERTVDSACPGSAVVVRLDCEGSVAGFSSLGEPGTPAERVGEAAADAAASFVEGGAAVDRQTADQLLVFLALAGGRLRIPTVTDHVEGGLALLEAFGFDLEVADGPVVAG